MEIDPGQAVRNSVSVSPEGPSVTSVKLDSIRLLFKVGDPNAAPFQVLKHLLGFLTVDFRFLVVNRGSENGTVSHINRQGGQNDILSAHEDAHSGQ